MFFCNNELKFTADSIDAYMFHLCVFELGLLFKHVTSV